MASVSRREVLELEHQDSQNFSQMQKQVDILIGLKCNQKCFFCFQEDESILSKDSKPNISNILRQLIVWYKKGYKRVNIAGGEATIYPELIPVLNMSQKLWYKQIKLVSNSVRFADMDYAKKVIPYLTDLAISFHAPDPKIQDEHTKMKGSFELLHTAIKNIHQIHPNIYLINHTVITSRNYHLLREHTLMLISLGFKRIDFLNMMPNTSLNKEYFISPEVIAPILMSIIDDFWDKIVIEICYTQPCYYPGYESYISGFDYARDFTSNRQDALLSWQQTLLDFKVVKKKCKTCSYFKDCRGFWDESKIGTNAKTLQEDFITS